MMHRELDRDNMQEKDRARGARPHVETGDRLPSRCYARKLGAMGLHMPTLESLSSCLIWARPCLLMGDNRSNFNLEVRGF